MKPKTIAVIKWIDQYSTDWAVNANEVLHEVVGETTGFLIGENKNCIAVSAEYFEHRDSCRHTITIPKCCIKSIKRFKV